MFQELVETVEEFEDVASRLSDLLKKVDLSDVPYCDRDLNQIPIGDKVKVAKLLIRIFVADSVPVEG